MSIEKTSPFKTAQFWWVSLTPVVIAAVMAGKIYPGIDFTACQYGDCLRAAVEYFKIPLLTAALFLPFAGLMASNHRAAQQAESIRMQAQSIDDSSKQFALTNHFSRKKEFEEHIKSHALFTHTVSIGRLYQCFYPNSSKGDYSLDKALIRKCTLSAEAFCDYAQTNLSALNPKPHPNVYLAIHTLHSYAVDLSFILPLHGNLGTNGLGVRINELYGLLNAASTFEDPYGALPCVSLLSEVFEELTKYKLPNSSNISEEVCGLARKGDKKVQDSIDIDGLSALQEYLNYIWDKPKLAKSLMFPLPINSVEPVVE